MEAEPADELSPLDTTPLPPPPTPYELALAAIDEFEQNLFAQAFRPSEVTMADDVKSINRRRHLRPLLHQRWLQPVPERDNPVAVAIATPNTERAPPTLNGFAKVEGFIEVTVSRYLHFAPTLWYHADNLGMDPLPFPVSARRAQNGSTADAASAPYMELRESRRMRSTDLHYLDHPKIGVIVRIDPVEIPEALEAQLQSALDEAQ